MEPGKLCETLGVMGRLLLFLAVIPLFPLLVVVILVQNLFGWGKIKAGPDYVADYLEKFIAETEGPWDWDDFCSIPIADPNLDNIRLQACGYSPPGGLSEAGRDELRRLLAEVRAL